MKIALLALLFALPAAAAETPASKLIDNIEGVYKHRFTNGIVVPGKPDEKYEAEDIVEVVRHDDSHIYVRASLSFYNGHHCGISAIATFDKGKFIYQDAGAPFSGEQCTLTVSVAGDALQLSDRLTPKGASTCKSLCGARGSLGEYTIPMSKRAKIRYLPKIKASKEYAAAVKGFEEGQR